jgi:hypothetical protein
VASFEASPSLVLITAEDNQDEGLEGAVSLSW